MTKETQIHPLAVLQKDPNASGQFKLVIRWLLGTGNELPRYDDTFKLSVQLHQKTGEGEEGDPLEPIYLQRDGAVTDQATWIDVKPKNHFMVEPPRRWTEIGPPAKDGDTKYQARAKEPTGPVDPSAADKGNLKSETDPFETLAVGVIHILKEVEPATVARRGAEVLYRTFRQRMDQTNLEPLFETARSSKSSEGDGFAGWAARQFAGYALRTELRIQELPQMIEAANSQVRSRVSRARLDERRDIAMPAIYDLPETDLSEKMAYAALVSQAFSDPTVRDQFAEAIEGPTMTRQQLRLRALQGGKLLNYWCDDPNLSDECEPSERGKTEPAAEILGTGLTIANISAETVQGWIDDNRQLTVRLRHEPSPETDRSETNLEASVPGFVGARELQVEKWGSNISRPLRPEHELARALSEGSSNLPPAPISAEVNYDLTQSNAGIPNAEDPNDPAPDEIRTTAFETGDGKVQFLITPPGKPDWADPDEEHESKTVYAFNVYGIWESADGASAFFKETPKRASLADIKPWRLTGRYSYTRDLSGAFPTPGNYHPDLEILLNDPPWFPVMERPDLVRDRTPLEVSDGAPAKDPGLMDRELPIPGRTGLTAFSIDLRKGMAVKGDAARSVVWDLEGEPNFEWTPELDRDLNPLADAPLRYRFWVTSVDPFEQESDPVPVIAHDAQAGEDESLFFLARRRTPLAPPPQRDDIDTVASSDGPGTETLHLRVNDDVSALHVKWETPFAQLVGTNEEESRDERVDPDMLEPTVLIYRKRLGLQVSDAVTSKPARLDLQETPQWRAFDESQSERGFTFFKAIESGRITRPTDGGIEWNGKLPLVWEDRGFEYVAGIAMRIRDEKQVFWHPDAFKGKGQGRLVVGWTQVDGKPQEYPTWITEQPTHSDIADTNAVTVTNPRPPRAPKPDAELSTKLDWYRADPVLPVRHVQRDDVLLKLLTHPVAGEDNPGAWRDTGVSLTTAQKLMCDTALARTERGIGDDLDALRLKVARRLLAEEFGAARPDKPAPEALRAENADLAEPQVLLQHATLGFRGVRTLRWTYSPFSAEEPVPDREAEAVLFRVYQARVPRRMELAKAYATFFGDASKQGDASFGLSGVGAKFEEAIKAVAERGQPAAALILGEDDSVTLRRVIAVDATDSDAPVVTVSQEEGPLPERASLIVIGAQPLAEMHVRDFGEEPNQRYALDIPVGGGEAEDFVWWITSVSAQGTETGPGARLVIRQAMPMTIEPQPPAEFRALPPWDRDAHLVDATDTEIHRFIPSRIRGNKDLARNNPRLLVTWKKTQEDSKPLIEIRRRRRKLSQGLGGEGLVARLSSEISDFDALKRIETTAADASLDPAAVAKLGQSWLLGKTVVHEDELRTPSDEAGAVLIGRSMRLSAVSGPGLIAYENPATSGISQTGQDPDTQPAFVDYYLQTGNPDLAMEGSYAYSYQGGQLIDLDPDGLFDLDEDVRYLPSRPTAWTAHQEPGTTKFVLSEPQETKTADVDPALPPLVEFRFSVPADQVLRQAGFRETDSQIRSWFYQIVVRRKIEHGISPGEDATFEGEWEDVGKPIRLRFADENKSIVDDMLERVSPDATISVKYQINISQFAEVEEVVWDPERGKYIPTGKAIDEVLVRRDTAEDGNGKEFSVTLAGMPQRTGPAGMPELLAEWHHVLDFNIT